ncbi:hypothetical protein AB4254_19285 [Vibrio breoganii]
MQKISIIKWVFAAIFVVLAYFSGRYVNQEFVYHDERVHSGIWEGAGNFFVNDDVVQSNLVLIIEPNNTRVSIRNFYNGFNFAVDANVTLKYSLTQHVYAEISNRSTVGLEEFISQTGLFVPRIPSLLTMETWRMEKGSLFMNVLDSGEIIGSYKLHKKHTL